MPSELAANALVSLAEFKAYLEGNAAAAAGTGNDAALERCINRASTLLEQALDRKIVSQGTITEYHTIDSYRYDLWLSQYPIVSVTTVHESDARTYDADSLLIVDTDYLISKPQGRLIRLAGTDRDLWLVGFRTVKVVYVAGYRSPAGLPAEAQVLPQHLVNYCLEVAAKLWNEQTSRQWGISNQSDGAGNWTRWEAAALSKDIKDSLFSDRRPTSGATTWELDA